jgi:penicillin-binding protein 1A
MARKARAVGVFGRLVRWVIVAGLLAVGLGGLILYRELSSDLPPVDQLLRYQPPTATRVFADDGTLIGEFYVERRYLVPLSRVPMHVRLAFLGAEDADFYRHRGVDPMSIVRALVNNMRSGSKLQGGSTITQQVVKNLLLTNERSWQRKAREAILALKLETKLSKDDILYLYLNQIYFGGNAYGIAAAAKTYFDVEVEDLSVAQAALLAGLPQAPSRYDPLRQSKQAIARQHYVLDRMLSEGFLNREQYDAAEAEQLHFAPRKPGVYLAAPWYVEHVRRLLEDRYGPAAAQLGLRVHTAVDVRLQDAAEKALAQGLRDLDRRQGFRGPVTHLEGKEVPAYLKRQAEGRAADETHRNAVILAVRPDHLEVRTAWETGSVAAEGIVWNGKRLAPTTFHAGDVVAVTLVDRAPDGSTTRFALDQDPQVEGALVSIDPYTGQVKAMVGGYSFGRSHFNRAVQAHRQPGSSFKPLIYAAAMENGFTPASIVLDAPITFTFGGQTWSPQNFKGKYYGPQPLRWALTRSLNTVTVRLVDKMGIDTVRRSLGRFGFEHQLPRNLSIALGSAEVTPLELVRAYGVFATLGKLFDPIFITAVTDADGNQIDFGGTRPHFERVMDPGVAFVVTSMMQSVVEKGTGQKAKELGRPVAGKTGTTNDTHDAWFVGFTPDLIAGVWVGFDAERSLGSHETGGVAACPIWTNYMKQALEGQPVIDFTVPKDVTQVHVDPGSGLRAYAGGPAQLEYFVAGTEPVEVAEPPVAETIEEIGTPAGTAPTAPTPVQVPSDVSTGDD